MPHAFYLNERWLEETYPHGLRTTPLTWAKLCRHSGCCVSPPACCSVCWTPACPISLEAAPPWTATPRWARGYLTIQPLNYIYSKLHPGGAQLRSAGTLTFRADLFVSSSCNSHQTGCPTRRCELDFDAKMRDPPTCRVCEGPDAGLAEMACDHYEQAAPDSGAALMTDSFPHQPKWLDFASESETVRAHAPADLPEI